MRSSIRVMVRVTVRAMGKFMVRVRVRVEELCIDPNAIIAKGS